MSRRRRPPPAWCCTTRRGKFHRARADWHRTGKALCGRDVSVILEEGPSATSVTRQPCRTCLKIATRPR